MLTGQVGVCHNAGPHSFGTLVENITHSTAYHVITAISETECVSPEWQGALRRPISRFADVTWSQFDYTDAQRQGVVDWVTKRIGRPYAWLDDIVIGVSDLTGWRIPPTIAHYLSGDLWYMCSELATCAVYYGAGLRPFPTKYPGEVTPRDWDEFIQSQITRVPASA